MSTCRRSTAPATWDDVRDPAFFRLTARLFGPDFCLGATVLLASYDDDAQPVEPVPAPVALHPRVAPQPARGRAA